MSYCRKIGGMVTVPECLACEECLPPGDRIDGQMCEYEDMDEEE